MGLALRRPPRVAEQPRGRRRARRDDPVLPGRRPGVVARCSAAPSTGRSAGSRTWPASWSARSTPDLAARAVLLEQAPSDFVTANRTTVSEGDQVIPLAGVWRDERFPDDGEQAKLQALSDAIDAAAGLHPDDHRTVELHPGAQGRRRPRPRRVPARAAAGAARHLLRPGPGQRLAAGVVRRRGARRRALRLGRPDRAGGAALLPAAGAAAARRVGQHPARRQPRALGVA